MKKLKLAELCRIPAEEYRNAAKMPVLVLLDNIRSLHNVGSAFRSADAFLVEKIMLTGITGTPPHREIQKTALGATESVPWEYAESPSAAVRKLREEGYRIVVIEQAAGSVPLERFNFGEGLKLAFVFGNEVNGVSDEVMELANEAIEIPQGGSKHSLNVSVCAGIVLWQAFLHFKLNPKS